MVRLLNDWVFLESERLRDLVQELFEPVGSLEQALVLVSLVSGEMQQQNIICVCTCAM